MRLVLFVLLVCVVRASIAPKTFGQNNLSNRRRKKKKKKKVKKKKEKIVENRTGKEKQWKNNGKQRDWYK